MQERKIMVANTKTQQRHEFMSAATTLGELQDEMRVHGIDFEGMSFTEGITKTQLIDRESLLPTNVMFKGQPTNNIVMILTNTSKNIQSGALSRREVYDIIKTKGLKDDITSFFGDSYTRVSTAELESFISDSIEEPAEESYEENFREADAKSEAVTRTCCEEHVNPAPHAELVGFFYSGLKALVKYDLLYKDDIAAIAELTAELAARLKESVQITDHDVDDMIANL